MTLARSPQAKRLEMIRGDHAKNATALDHVERAMTPHQDRSTRPPYSTPSARHSSKPPRNEPTSPPRGGGASLPWSPHPPHAMDRVPSSSPAPDLSSYTVPTPARQNLNYSSAHNALAGGGRGHDLGYHAPVSKESPISFSGPPQSSGLASGSCGVATGGGDASPQPSEGGGGGLRNSGVVARFLEEVQPLLARMGPPFSSAFPDRVAHEAR